jgi:hypothetical protein
MHTTIAPLDINAGHGELSAAGAVAGTWAFLTLPAENATVSNDNNPAGIRAAPSA